ncbi:hypothetical protein RF11_09347 [Thelohanellus kitauei]|uniref:Uncharacterized protein n=1 Tax=Thelohanellus kitauei TaxID=669202 RepID=A0A0C2MBH2_THEKT|nr:hypothetical protein RF11_09347 [Thelohanellus kitauei]
MKRSMNDLSPPNSFKSYLNAVKKQRGKIPKVLKAAKQFCDPFQGSQQDIQCVSDDLKSKMQEFNTEKSNECLERWYLIFVGVKEILEILSAQRKREEAEAEAEEF